MCKCEKCRLIKSIKSIYKSCDVFVQLAFLLAGNWARKDVAKSSRSKNCLLQKLVFKYFKRKDLCL